MNVLEQFQGAQMQAQAQAQAQANGAQANGYQMQNAQNSLQAPAPAPVTVTSLLENLEMLLADASDSAFAAEQLADRIAGQVPQPGVASSKANGADKSTVLISRLEEISSRFAHARFRTQEALRRAAAGIG